MVDSNQTQGSMIQADRLHTVASRDMHWWVTDNSVVVIMANGLDHGPNASVMVEVVEVRGKNALLLELSKMDLQNQPCKNMNKEQLFHTDVNLAFV